ncbi:hypothetical protein BIY23_04385 [Wolbachia pipientis]|uniref:Uncharacterized protein n=2 Tax=Wolbachia pipientis TaxID=955 RepID=A0A1E7QIS9_WOLPI|nr:hypothetical protein BIY23_04385 [Wolbachia pipientis]
MFFEKVILCGIVLLILIKVFFSLKQICFKKIVEAEHKKDDELYKKKKEKKDLEKRQELLRTNQLQVYKENVDIVEIMKPVGKWTQMVMHNGGILLRLAQLIKSEGREKGFWELFVKAQASTQGKYKGKGR